MRTFLTLLTAVLLAAPLVVLVLRGTRFDPVRRTRRNSPARAVGRSTVDADRAARDLVAAGSVHEPPEPAQPAASAPIAKPGRSIHFSGSTSGTKPTLA